MITSLDISNRLWVFELGFHPQKFNFYQKYPFIEKKEIEHGRGKNIKPKQSWFERHRLGGVELQKYRKVENLTFFSFSIRKKN